AAGDYPGSERCVVRWVTDEPDRLVLDAEAPGPAFLVVADTWFPGWVTRVDGAEAPIRRVDHLLRGVALPARRHRLPLVHGPDGWGAAPTATRAAWGLWLVLAALAAGIALRGRAAVTASAG